jgi:hypothetical protein
VRRVSRKETEVISQPTLFTWIQDIHGAITSVKIGEGFVCRYEASVFWVAYFYFILLNQNEQVCRRWRAHAFLHQIQEVLRLLQASGHVQVVIYHSKEKLFDLGQGDGKRIV